MKNVAHNMTKKAHHFSKQKYFLPVLIVVGMALFGTYLFVASHADSQTNLITKSNVSTSSLSNLAQFAPSMVADGDSKTRFISQSGDVVTLTADLGKTINVSKVSILWSANTTKQYDVQISNDNVNWTTIASATTNNTPSELIEHTQFLATPTGRYIRIKMNTNWYPQYGHAIWEWGVYGSAPATTTQPPASGTNSGTGTAGNSNTAKIALVSQINQRCMGSLPNNDASLELYTCNANLSQTFNFNSAGEIRSLSAPNKCVGISNNVSSIGATVQLFDCNSGYTVQKWLYYASTGELKGQSDRCLSVGNPGSNNGIGLLLNNCTGSADQRWSFGKGSVAVPTPAPTAPTPTPTPTPAPNPTPTPTPTPPSQPAPPTTGYVVKLTSKGGNCNGSADNTDAFVSALGDLRSHGGGTLVLPSGHCVVNYRGSINISRNITVQGTSQSQSFIDVNVPNNGYSYPFTISDLGGDLKGAFNVTLQDFTMQRLTLGSGIMLDFPGAANNIHINNVKIDGRGYNYDYTEDGIQHSGNDFSAIKVEQVGWVTDVAMKGISISGVCYGFLTDSDFHGGVINWSVDGSTFTKNYCDDLEFNAPETLHENNISVTNSHFSNNLYNGPHQGAGIGVGFANVRGSAGQYNTIAGNDFDGYNLDAIHLEDRTAFVNVSGNSTIHSFTDSYGYAAHVLIVSSTNNVNLNGNTCDTSGTTNGVSCVLVSPGCASCTMPTGIFVSGNTFKLRAGATAVAGGATVGANNIIQIH